MHNASRGFSFLFCFVVHKTLVSAFHTYLNETELYLLISSEILVNSLCEKKFQCNWTLVLILVDSFTVYNHQNLR